MLCAEPARAAFANAGSCGEDVSMELMREAREAASLNLYKQQIRNPGLNKKTKADAGSVPSGHSSQ